MCLNNSRRSEETAPHTGHIPVTCLKCPPSGLARSHVHDNSTQLAATTALHAVFADAAAMLVY